MIPTRVDEIDAIRQRYERRRASAASTRYSMLKPWVYMSDQERERALIRLITKSGLTPVSDKRVLEIGCGRGGNLLQLLRLGFTPGNMVANELLADRALAARAVLPSAIPVLVGDAATLDLPPRSFDIVLQSTVFSSILDRAFQAKLAARLWRLVKPGGGVLWYDFVYDNPRNPDVAGIAPRRIRELFPEAKVTVWRVTLAPPLSRAVTQIHPGLYGLFNACRFLRTHVLCWISGKS